MSSKLAAITMEDDNNVVVELPVTSRTLVQWERQFKGRTAAQLDNASITMIYEIAYVAATRAQKFNGSMTDFENSFDVAMDNEEGDVPN